jgi:two-component system, NtrC family, sensor histidine kinase PilS
VDDVLILSAPGSAIDIRIDLLAEVSQVTQQWYQTAVPGAHSTALGSPQCPVELINHVASPANTVCFDPEHLRRVLVNLLDNAWRHSRQEPGSVLITLKQTDKGAYRLSVLNDGQAVDVETEQHLFEPFHSTRSRGTGLGLYISRELCERYRAYLDYYPRRARDRHVTEFCITFSLIDQTT